MICEHIPAHSFRVSPDGPDPTLAGAPPADRSSQHAKLPRTQGRTSGEGLRKALQGEVLGGARHVAGGGTCRAPGAGTQGALHPPSPTLATSSSYFFKATKLQKIPCHRQYRELPLLKQI
ncbi:hypothetical protein XENTR_v10002326 [Xenopus tropicalis]|nr:hypothetical protein XENTR_v10002326 [Xenopus tropicalis]